MRFILLFFAAFLFSTSGNAQVDITDLVKVTQNNEGNVNEVRLAWWIPFEFWEAVMQSQGLPDEQAAGFLVALQPYTFVGVIEGEREGMVINYTDSDKIERTIELTGTNGKTYEPISEGDLPMEVAILLNTFTPILQNMMGELGANFNFYVFSDYEEDGTRICDPYEEGRVEVKFSKSEHSFRSPLGPLLPPKECPTNNETFAGDYNFCPYCGAELEEVEE